MVVAAGNLQIRAFLHGDDTSADNLILSMVSPLESTSKLKSKLKLERSLRGLRRADLLPAIPATTSSCAVVLRVGRLSRISARGVAGHCIVWIGDRVAGRTFASSQL